jgi:hypothetical protein
MLFDLTRWMGALVVSLPRPPPMPFGIVPFSSSVYAGRGVARVKVTGGPGVRIRLETSPLVGAFLTPSLLA